MFLSPCEKPYLQVFTKKECLKETDRREIGDEIFGPCNLCIKIF